MATRKPRPSDDGFTLVNLLVTSVLMGVVAQGMAKMIISQAWTQARQELRSDCFYALIMAAVSTPQTSCS